MPYNFVHYVRYQEQNCTNCARNKSRSQGVRAALKYFFSRRNRFCFRGESRRVEQVTKRVNARNGVANRRTILIMRNDEETSELQASRDNRDNEERKKKKKHEGRR